MAFEEIDTSGTARRALEKLKGRDLAIICDIFVTESSGNRKQKISRLVKLGIGAHTRLVRLSRLVQLGYSVEPYVTSAQLKDMLKKHDLRITGGKHELYMRLVKNDRVPVTQIVNGIRTESIRRIYSDLLEKTPIAHDSQLREELLKWIDFRFPSLGKKSIAPQLARPVSIAPHSSLRRPETSVATVSEMIPGTPCKADKEGAATIVETPKLRIDAEREEDPVQSKKTGEVERTAPNQRYVGPVVTGVSICGVGITVLSLGYTIDDGNLLLYQVTGIALVVCGLIAALLMILPKRRGNKG